MVLCVIILGKADPHRYVSDPMTSKERETSDIHSARLSEPEYARGFCDLVPPLDLQQAAAESSRCYYCYDAPCIQACPTQINIPSFIQRIHSGNLKGAATEILSANILGGTCSRVCPVEILCEDSCVRNTDEDKPVAIGRLQKHAVDWLFENRIQPFERAALTGKKIAVVGSGPAGLSCAHRLAMLGHDVDVFEAKNKAGGLNEYGIAAYKMAGNFAQKEVEFLLSIGGIRIQTQQRLGQNLQLGDLRKKYDAVFLGIGLAGVNSLSVEGEALAGVRNAVDFISELRQSTDLATLPIGRRIVVIGGGNTAIDAAIQSKRLGAQEVTLVYRRGMDQMSATHHEQELAQINGVLIRHWAQPLRIEGRCGAVAHVVFERTHLNENGKLEGTGELFSIDADQVFKAVGQQLMPTKIGEGKDILEIHEGKIRVDARGETSLENVYAGGDCIDSGEDLTVQAVQDGKVAAWAIDEKLTGRKHPWPI